MSKLPKIQDFKAPEGYFDKLPDEILFKTKEQNSFGWMKYAAAAIFILGFGYWQWPVNTEQSEWLAMETEVNLYIDSQYWTAEDVLSFSENPDEILAGILDEEFTFVEENLEDYDDILWQ